MPPRPVSPTGWVAGRGFPSGSPSSARGESDPPGVAAAEIIVIPEAGRPPGSLHSGQSRIAAVDLQEKRQHDIAGQMARVKRRARPWRSIIAAILAVLAAAVRYQAPRFITDAGYGRGASAL